MKLTKVQKLKLYKNLVRARTWDLMIASRLTRGKLIAFFHQAEGGEAPGVGACSFLNQDDYLWPHYRGHGVPHMLSKGINAKTYLAEHVGMEGCSGGLSAFHPFFPDYKVFGWCGAVGFQFHVSVGFAMAAKRDNNNQIVMTCSGDGGTNRGIFHESLLMAANWKLPLVFVCENNGLAMFVPFKDTYPVDNVADIVKGYGIQTKIVDGQDVFAVAEAVNKAVAKARKGQGPQFIECKTVRYNEHDIGTPDLAGNVLRTEEEINKLKKRDPIALAQARLLEEKIIDEKSIAQIEKDAQQEIDEAEAYVETCSKPNLTILKTALYAE